MKRSAVISEDGLYRYELRRVWDPLKPLINFVLLNPSKADAQIDDQTVRRLIRFARTWGFGGIIVTNLYAYRSTNPRKLWDVIDPVGPENERYLKAAAQEADKVVCAWGANASLERAEDVRRLLLHARDGAFIPNVLYCFGKTKGLGPKHPLRLNSNTELRAM
jgi:hypothetical protein